LCATAQGTITRLGQASPAAGPERARLQQWLGFIGTELHKATFLALNATLIPSVEEPALDTANYVLGTALRSSRR